MPTIAVATGSDDGFELLPECRAVYLITTAGEPVIGRTARLRTRMRRLFGAAPESPRDHDGAAQVAASRRSFASLRGLGLVLRYTPVGSDFESDWELYRLVRQNFPERYRRLLRLPRPAFVRLNLRNRFPRVQVTRALGRPPSIDYGPFRSRLAAERFSQAFQSHFRIRRCIEQLHPDPAFPGCMYGEMKACLAPCQCACSEAEYALEVRRVRDFLESRGGSLLAEWGMSRERAAAELAFERAGELHARVLELQSLLRSHGRLAAPIGNRRAILLLPSPNDSELRAFTLAAGCLRGPFELPLPGSEAGERQRWREAIERIEIAGSENQVADAAAMLGQADSGGEAPSRRQRAEHLGLLARWFYRKRRVGEFVEWEAGMPLPWTRLLNAGRRLATGENPAAPESDA
jgi:excinuclease ABC subunit C